MRRIARELATLLDARYAAVGLLGEDGHLIAFETTGLTPEEEALLRPQPPHGRGILGALLREGQPLRLDDLTRDPRSVGFPPGHPPMRTFLGVPLVVGGAGPGAAVRHRAAREAGRRVRSRTRTRRWPWGSPPRRPWPSRAPARRRSSSRAERLRATGELAVGVAHDFNNLLATILGRAEVLLGQVRDPEQRESLAAIQRAARDGAATVARMREYGRPVDASAFRPVDLGALAREAVELTRPRWQDEAQREGRTIAVRIDAGAGAGPGAVPPVQGDPVALREVLVNLLFNAFDALPAGGHGHRSRVAPRRGAARPGRAAAAAGLGRADRGGHGDGHGRGGAPARLRALLHHQGRRRHRAGPGHGAQGGGRPRRDDRRRDGARAGDDLPAALPARRGPGRGRRTRTRRRAGRRRRGRPAGADRASWTTSRTCWRRWACSCAGTATTCAPSATRARPWTPSAPSARTCSSPTWACPG